MYPVRAARAIGLALLLAPLFAHAALELRISESTDEKVRIEVAASGAGSGCAAANATLFGQQLNIAKASDHLYFQPLNSEVGDDAVYLKAARMGGGIYMHLPYFVPEGDCKGAVFAVSAKHILWDGTWYAGEVTVPAGAARNKSIFFTNEQAPIIRGARYFDASMPASTLASLDSAFARIVAFYGEVLKADPMRGTGVVAAIVHNGGNYSGFGGDALNIIRMSYDNPKAKDLSTFEQVFPSTFAHELAHKLQSERLFELPYARQVVEGSADFLKIVVLHSAGVVDERQARDRVRKAIADCAGFANAKSLAEKAATPGSINFREPYDCGMAYYFAAYYSSGMAAPEFIATLRLALSGERRYGERTETLCLLFEADCQNARLKGIVANRERFLAQADWLESQLASQPMPFLGKLAPTVP